MTDLGFLPIWMPLYFLPLLLIPKTTYISICFDSDIVLQKKKKKKKGFVGISLWHRRLSIQHCHCSSPGHCYGADSIPVLETSICHRGSRKNKVFAKHFKTSPHKITDLTKNRKKCILQIVHGDLEI